MEHRFTLQALLSRAYNEGAIAGENSKFFRHERPRKSVVQAIMDYSKSLSVYHSQSLGVIKININ